MSFNNKKKYQVLYKKHYCMFPMDSLLCTYDIVKFLQKITVSEERVAEHIIHASMEKRNYFFKIIILCSTLCTMNIYYIKLMYFALY